ncbi:B12-binding domain-containing radical SAM protein [Candidatus Woesearchaeota archaeon]|nr:B12-binding domain-containing radical SAM protein [Candidatus Woesearchaeota archaeon]
MADALLINAKGFKLINDQTLPFGLLYTAGYSLKDFTIKILDQRVDEDFEKHLLQELKQNPMVVGITCMTGPMILDALRISKAAKENSSAMVVWGGIHPTLDPEVTLENPLIDAVVLGEGEITFNELLKAVRHGKTLDGIEGIWFKDKGGNIRKNPPRKEITNLDTIERPPYELLDIERYIQIKDSRGSTRSLNMFTSRGCPHKCIYCYNLHFNKAYWRQMSTNRVNQELKYIVDTYRLKNVFFLDDNFMVNMKRVNDIAAFIKDEFSKKDFTWDILGAQVSTLKNVSSEELQFLDSTHCQSMMIGIETGSPRMMELIHKGITVEQVIEVNKKLASTNIRPYYSFMTGFPTETDDDRVASIKLMFQVKKENPHANVGTMKPVMIYPGTDIFQTALQHGFKPPKKLEDWAGFTWDNFVNIDYPWLSRKEKKRLVHMYYYTLLLNPDHLYINSRLFTLGSRILYPLAKFRLNHQIFALPIESEAIHFVQRNFM